MDVRMDKNDNFEGQRNKDKNVLKSGCHQLAAQRSFYAMQVRVRRHNWMATASVDATLFACSFESAHCTPDRRRSAFLSGLILTGCLCKW